MLAFARSSQNSFVLALLTASLTNLCGCHDDKKSDDISAADEKTDKSSKKKKKKKKAEAKADAAKPKASADSPEDGSVAAPKAGEIPSLIIGGWSEYKMKTGTAKFQVLEQKGTEMLVDGHIRGAIDLAVQSWVNVPDQGDTSTSRIVSLRYRLNGGPVQTFAGGGLTREKELYANLIKGFLPPKFEGLPQEDVTVAAGTFRGCFKWTSKSTFMGQTTETMVWSHPAVPAPAMVKSVTKEGNSFELVAYSKTGAKPSF